MSYPHTKILCTPKRLTGRLKYFRRKLARAANSEFWKKHLQNNNFVFSPEKFDWNYWQTLPFFEKNDLLRLGFGPRLRDMEPRKKHKAFYALRTTSGTTMGPEPVLLLHKVRPLKRHRHKKYGTAKILWLESSFASSLIGILSGISGERKFGYISPSLVLPPPSARFAGEALSHFSPTNIHATSPVLAHLVNYLKDIATLKKINLTGDFVDNGQIRSFRSLFPRCKIIIMYGVAELGGRTAKACRRARKKFGPYAFHASDRRWQLTELADCDAEGTGEIILTRLKPGSAALIRYRTGDMARMIEKKCGCGEKFILILMGRKNHDFIKCAGALITRPELTRVLQGAHSAINDWRAEFEEASAAGKIIGRLTLKIKLHPGLSALTPAEIHSVSDNISKNMFVTPTKTFNDLVKENRFETLRIEPVKDFPAETKTRKIIRSS